MLRPAQNNQPSVRLRLVDPSDDRVLLPIHQPSDLTSDPLVCLPDVIDANPAQRHYCQLIQTAYPDLQRRIEQGDPTAREILDRLAALGEQLGVRLRSPGETLPHQVRCSACCIRDVFTRPQTHAQFPGRPDGREHLARLGEITDAASAASDLVRECSPPARRRAKHSCTRSDAALAASVTVSPGRARCSRPSGRPGRATGRASAAAG